MTNNWDGREYNKETVGAITPAPPPRKRFKSEKFHELQRFTVSNEPAKSFKKFQGTLNKYENLESHKWVLNAASFKQV